MYICLKRLYSNKMTLFKKIEVYQRYTLQHRSHTIEWHLLIFNSLGQK